MAGGEFVDVVEVVDADHHGCGGAEFAHGQREGLHGLDPARVGRPRRSGQRSGRGVGGQLSQYAQRIALFGRRSHTAQYGTAAGTRLRGDCFEEFAFPAADGRFDEK